MNNDYSTEIISLITETFDDDKQLVANMLIYLYDTTNCTNMDKQIEEWFETNHRCIGCGSKELNYQYFDWNLNEDINVWLCEECNRSRIREIKEYGKE